MNKKKLLTLIKVNENGCWIWQRSTRGAGYAQCSKCDDPSRIASRMVYKMYHGPIPDGLLVMHSCDTPLCVNPDHLSAGTHSDNVQDMVAKKRYNHRNRTAYNTVNARTELSARYKDDAFRLEQGRKIREAFAKKKDAALITDFNLNAWKLNHQRALWAFGAQVGGA